MPGVCPTSTVKPKYSTANTSRLRLRGSSGAVNRAATRLERTTSTRKAPSRGAGRGDRPRPGLGQPGGGHRDELRHTRHRRGGRAHEPA